MATRISNWMDLHDTVIVLLTTLWSVCFTYFVLSLRHRHEYGFSTTAPSIAVGSCVHSSLCEGKLCQRLCHLYIATLDDAVRQWWNAVQMHARSPYCCDCHSLKYVRMENRPILNERIRHGNRAIVMASKENKQGSLSSTMSKSDFYLRFNGHRLRQLLNKMPSKSSALGQSNGSETVRPFFTIIRLIHCTKAGDALNNIQSIRRLLRRGNAQRKN